MDEMEQQKPKRVEAQRLKGFRDLMPQSMFVRQHVMDTLRSIFELHGFAPLETPSLEYASTLEGKYGEEERLIYKFEDKGGRKVGMRYDLTVPLARVVAMHLNELTFPWKRYQMSPVWRGENPQYGRYREFYQCDADIVGSASLLADAEVVSIYAEAMEKLGFKNYRILINHRRIISGVGQAFGIDPRDVGMVARVIDKIDKIGAKGAINEFLSKGVRYDVAAALVDIFQAGGDVKSITDSLSYLRAFQSDARIANQGDIAQGIADLKELFEYLRTLDLDENRFSFAVSLARGLDYYTGPVYEVVVEEPKIGSLGGGGRYDDLMTMFTGRGIPTTGASFGLERIIDVMIALNMYEHPPTPSRVLITIFDAGRESAAASIQIASDLRAQGIPCEVYLNPGDKLGKQFAYADRLGIPFAVVIGPDELAAGTVTVKELKSPPPNQRTITRGELAGVLRDE